MRKIKFGGDLQKGDFIAYSYSNYIGFGWYVGTGRGGSLQYYNYRAPKNAEKDYDDFMNEINTHHWSQRRFKNGFTLKTIHKDFIISVTDHRICKINPMDIFTEQEDIRRYERSREILINFNFIER